MNIKMSFRWSSKIIIYAIFKRKIIAGPSSTELKY